MAFAAPLHDVGDEDWHGRGTAQLAAATKSKGSLKRDAMNASKTTILTTLTDSAGLLVQRLCEADLKPLFRSPQVGVPAQAQP